jgi:ABC-type spermidine/putrescine transport system permease subunit I
LHEHRSYRCGTQGFHLGSEHRAVRSVSQEAGWLTIMLATVLGAVLPMVVTVLLGFVAAWHHDFGSKDAPILNRMVLVYAVPLALFP